MINQEKISGMNTLKMKDKIWKGNLKKHKSKNFLIKFLNNKLKKDIIKVLKKMNFQSLLDIGCGEGFITYKIAKNFPKVNITAIDPGQDYINYAKKFNSSENIKYLQGDINSFNSQKFDTEKILPTRSNFRGAQKPEQNKTRVFDIVVMTEVLEHLPNPKDSIKKALSLSKKYLLISVPNEPYFRIGNLLSLKYVKNLGNTPGHLHNWSKTQLKEFLSKYSKKVIIKTSTFWNIALITL